MFNKLYAYFYIKYFKIKLKFKKEKDKRFIY